MYDEKIRALRMERQHLLTPANETEYDALYRDLQPGQNVYWNGFGQPPTLSFRADFDDLAYNKSRQFRRELIKGRFAGGNLGWILPEDLELFAALYRKPLKNATMTQQMLLERIEMSGPYTIGQLKEESGLLVKEITPALHRLQEAFLIYEDQYDGEWDRGWYRFDEFFSDFSLDRYTKTEALKIVLRRFAHRFVWFTPAMAKSFYKLPEKEIKLAIAGLVANCMEIFHTDRKKTTLVLALIYLAASAVIALGYSVFYFNVTLPNGSSAQLLDIMDYVSNSVMMPLIALLSTVLSGWVKSPKYVADEMERGGYKFRRKRMYYVMIRYVAPVMMLVLFLQSTGLLSMIFK